MKSPKVAIITRTKDRPLFLKRAIQSVLKQDFDDWIHVIVNDGGDPAKVDLLVSVNKDAYDGRVKVVHHAESKGMQNASNAGMEASDSAYAVIHDDDDSWYPDFLESTVGFLEKEGPDSLVQGVVTQTTQVFEEVCLSGEIREIRKRPYYPFDFVSMEELRKRNLFAPIAFLYRRSAHEKVGPFRQEFDVLGDHDFNLRFLRHFEIGVLPTFHAYYHWRHGSHGNTVTRAREVHRRMLSRLKNTYHRDLLDNPDQAVGDLEKIDFPPKDTADLVPFKLRTEEPAKPRDIPDFKKSHPFSVLSLDVFDTVLLRRCHHPKDVFKFLQERAVRDLGLPDLPYALAREEAEQLARMQRQSEASQEVTHEEIYLVLAKLLRMKAAQRDQLRELELQIERELLYGDPRWIEFYRDCRADGTRVVFISDMYLPGDIVGELLESCGFPEPEVYLSCDYKSSKHEGTLQGKVAELLGVDPREILHVGDNFHSDLVQTVHAGWQAFHWSREFRYNPLYAQVEPFLNDDHDLLSLRLMGEVERMGLTTAEESEDLLFKIGMEIAGPLYLSYMLWVVQQAQRDGIRKLLLIGRDGYYWEKTLQMMGDPFTGDLEFSYLHASRKVYNFASFKELDERAMTFLKTPNPSLRVRDYIDRTGLKAEDYLEFIRIAGFPDPDEVLTNEMGGQFLDKSIPGRLEKLFRLLEPDLCKLFGHDRAGTLQVLEEAGYIPGECAFVDIGWSGSCVRPIRRLLKLDKETSVRAYFFGTWKEAKDPLSPVDYASYFFHFSKPDDRFQLIRESVNLIEALHSAPFSTLLAFQENGKSAKPVFSSDLKSGFSMEQQERLWRGAQSFLNVALERPLPPVEDGSGLVYLQLVLSRFLREPSPEEVRQWGGLLHSDGFGLEVYKPLIEPATPDMGGEELLQAYRGSSWKRGFLSAISEEQRNFILERIEKRNRKSVEELQADLVWKTRQADDLWSEKERWKWEAGHNKEQVDSLYGQIADLNKELDEMRIHLDIAHAEQETLLKTQEAREEELGEALIRVGENKVRLESSQKELEQARGELEQARGELEQARGELEQARVNLEQERERFAELCSIKDEADSKAVRLEEKITLLSKEIESTQADLEREKQKLVELDSVKTAAEAECERLSKRCSDLEAAFHKRSTTLKAFFSGKLPDIGQTDASDEQVNQP